ncbi:MAG TPA: murein biosynthesis integral membrane protein MurJ [Candidatus Brocadiia bacterium]|nr:murein biosynthesis integral membrane protein MurJ [Candidatus Brocadiia bacterium]
MPDNKFNLGNATRLISLLTLASRVLGLVRDSLIARTFGAGAAYDAFAFAFRVPNLFRRLFGEGALTAAFIPAFSECREKDGEEEAWRLFNVVFSFLLLTLTVILVAGELACLILPKTGLIAEKWDLPLKLLAVMFPYMPLICMTAFLAAMLQCRMRFGMAALSPTVLNVIWIASLLFVSYAFAKDERRQVYGVAIGILIAGVFQVGLQAWALRRISPAFRFIFDWRNPSLRKILVRMGPMIAGLAAVQLNTCFDGIMAVGLSGPEGGTFATIAGRAIRFPMLTGANSILYYGERLIEFPLGVFGIAVATAAFPAMSRAAAEKDSGAFRKALTDGLRLVIFIGVPASAGTILISSPLIELLFQRRAFTAVETARCARVVMASGIGIWAYCAIQVLARGFYSLGDVMTPVKTSATVVVLNLALNLSLVWFMREAGLSLATSLCATIQAVILYYVLSKRLPKGDNGPMLRCMLTTVTATAAMSVAVLLCMRLMPGIDPEQGKAAVFFLKCVRVGVPCCAGGAVYFLVAFLLRSAELKLLIGRGLA